MTVRSLAALLGTAVLVSATFHSLARAQQAPADTANAADSKSTSPAPTEKAKTKGQLEKATFGSGCFWCGEAVFEHIVGVKSVVSGYSGGNVPNPTYEEVSTGQTGHAEAFQVTFDPAVVSYGNLLKVFWATHDPTTPNQQGPDVGTQYRSVIFYHNDAQKTAAQKSYQELMDKRTFLDAISTQLVPLATFYPAEAYHQDYFRKHKGAAYCQTYIVPKLKKLQHIKLK